MTKSLTNRIILKERFFGFHMDPGKNLEQNLDDFKKIAIALASVDEDKIGDESQSIILLNSLPDSYKEVKAAIKFGRKIITLDDVISALRSWELEIKTVSKINGDGESLNVRGSQFNKNQNNNRSKSRSKSRNHGEKWWKSIKCYNCQEIGHTKRFYPRKYKRSKDQEETKGEVAVAEDGYDSAEVLIVSTSDTDRK